MKNETNPIDALRNLWLWHRKRYHDRPLHALRRAFCVSAGITKEQALVWGIFEGVK